MCVARRGWGLGAGGWRARRRAGDWGWVLGAGDSSRVSVGVVCQFVKDQGGGLLAGIGAAEDGLWDLGALRHHVLRGRRRRPDGWGNRRWCGLRGLRLGPGLALLL